MRHGRQACVSSDSWGSSCVPLSVARCCGCNSNCTPSLAENRCYLRPFTQGEWASSHVLACPRRYTQFNSTTFAQNTWYVRSMYMMGSCASRFPFRLLCKGEVGIDVFAPCPPHRLGPVGQRTTRRTAFRTYRPCLQSSSTAAPASWPVPTSLATSQTQVGPSRSARWRPRGSPSWSMCSCSR